MSIQPSNFLELQLVSTHQSEFLELQLVSSQSRGSPFPLRSTMGSAGASGTNGTLGLIPVLGGWRLPQTEIRAF